MIHAQPAAKARNAEGASWVVLLTPRRHRERCLIPGEVVDADIGNFPQKSSEEGVKGCEEE